MKFNLINSLRITFFFPRTVSKRHSSFVKLLRRELSRLLRDTLYGCVIKSTSLSIPGWGLANKLEFSVFKAGWLGDSRIPRSELSLFGDKLRKVKLTDDARKGLRICVTASGMLSKWNFFSFETFGLAIWWLFVFRPIKRERQDCPISNGSTYSLAVVYKICEPFRLSFWTFCRPHAGV